MKWFKVNFAKIELDKKLDKKLIRAFIGLLIKLNLPTGLAVHSIDTDEKSLEEINYYFSSPKQFINPLITLFTGFNFAEVLEPNKLALKTIVGSI